jgi:hypothetical protein
MVSLIWLIVWLVQGTPDLIWFGSWNDWAVALLGCIIFDVFSGREAGRQRGRKQSEKASFDAARLPLAALG